MSLSGAWQDYGTHDSIHKIMYMSTDSRLHHSSDTCTTTARVAHSFDKTARVIASEDHSSTGRGHGKEPTAEPASDSVQ